VFTSLLGLVIVSHLSPRGLGRFKSSPSKYGGLSRVLKVEEHALKCEDSEEASYYISCACGASKL
jgi:hypothetical protein